MKSRTNFTLKKPGKGRKSFSIIKRIISDSGTTYEKVECESIDSINKSLQDGAQDQTACEQQAKEVIKSLYAVENRKKPKIVHSSENLNLLEDYWNAEYSNRDLVSPESAKNDLSRAVESLGHLSLYSTPLSDLQKQISKVAKGNKQRRIVARLNQLLKFIDRKIKLRQDRKIKNQVRYLNYPDFQKIIPHITELNLRLIHEVAFYTGCRIGEIFAIKPEHIRQGTLLVQNQIDRKENKRETKNRLVRKAYILPEGREKVLEWSKVTEKLPYRHCRFSDVTTSACQKVFGVDEDKNLVFHDLRHSYAIHLLSHGVSLSLIAQSLGNSIQVCQEHYAGFTLSDDSIDAIETILKK